MIAASGALVGAAAAGFGATGIPEISVRTMPPSVVKTVPQAGDTRVDPGLTEVSVTFSKDMLTKENWSWCQLSPETFPEIDKTKIRYLDDKRTCVLPVKLKPEKTYVIWINTQKYNYFKDTEQRPAIPYLLVFQTEKKPKVVTVKKDETPGVSAARGWLKLIDGGEYAKSWDHASTLFKNAITKEKWTQTLGAVRRPLGRVLSRELLSETYKTSLPGAPDGRYVVIQFKTSYEKKKSAVETITPMMEDDGKWRVSGYYIK
jgi:hypothetical protein